MRKTDLYYRSNDEGLLEQKLFNPQVFQHHYLITTPLKSLPNWINYT